MVIMIICIYIYIYRERERYRYILSADDQFDEEHFGLPLGTGCTSQVLHQTTSCCFSRETPISAA